MGVNGLWRLVGPAKRLHTLEEISIEYWRKNDSEFRGLRVGIDTSMVMIMAMDEAKLQSELFPESSLDPTVFALRLLFHFLSSLFSIPTLLPVFFFDGKDRPNRKRGRNICTSEFAIEAELRSMCEAFGFPWWIAPGEAEWEMADLAKHGRIDACWTGDSDIFLAFPPLIFRLPFNFDALLNTVSPTPTRIQTYSSATLLALPTPLTPATFLFLATLIGGDYARGPLPPLLLDVPPSAPTHYSRKGLGILASLVGLSTTPYAPLPGTNFATSLTRALVSDILLEQWATLTRNALRSTLTKELHISSHPSWPSRTALNLYLTPLTTSSLFSSSSSTSTSPAPSLRGTTPSIPKLIDLALDTLLLLPHSISTLFLSPSGLIDSLVLQAWYTPHSPSILIGIICGEKGGKVRVAVGVREWIEEVREGLRGVGVGVGGSGEWGRGVWVGKEVVRERRGDLVEAWEEKKVREGGGVGLRESGFGSCKVGNKGFVLKKRPTRGVGKDRKVSSQKFSPIAVIVLD